MAASSRLLSSFMEFRGHLSSNAALTMLELQAAHYGVETGKRPCVALMIDKGLWPLAPATVEKLRTIEKTALAQGITLVLLRNGR
jgi:hypothetical protein